MPKSDLLGIVKFIIVASFVLSFIIGGIVGVISWLIPGV